MNSKYDDIINIPYHIWAKHRTMSMINRAAQFAPFAALPGYYEAVTETARLTSEKIELDESIIEYLNRKLQMIQKKICDNPVVSITFFKADKLKSGGAYLTFTNAVKRIDEYEKCVKFINGTQIPINDIYDIEIK